MLAMVKCESCGYIQRTDTDDTYQCDSCGSLHYLKVTEDDFEAH